MTDQEDKTRVVSPLTDGPTQSLLFIQVSRELHRLLTNQPTVPVAQAVTETRIGEGEERPSDVASNIQTAAKTRRRDLVERARSNSGALDDITLDGSRYLAPQSEPGLLVLEAALTRLAQFDEQAAQAMELTLFGGLTVGEVSQVLNVPQAVATEDVKIGKAWLAREMSQPA